MKFIIKESQLSVLLSENEDIDNINYSDKELSDMIFSKLNGYRQELVDEVKYGIYDILRLIKIYRRQTKLDITTTKFYQNSLKSSDILLKYGIISYSEHNSFGKKLLTRSLNLVYDDEGNWDIINKLNTNYTALARIITDILMENLSKPNTSEKFQNFINDILHSETLKEKNIGYKLKKLLKWYFTPKRLGLLKNYTHMISDTSSSGDNSEHHISNFLESKGYEILDIPGEGNFVDMMYSIDMIVKTPKGNVVTIQIKTSEFQLNNFIQDKLNNPSSKKYRYVDIILIPYKNGIKGYNFNLNKEI